MQTKRWLVQPSLTPAAGKNLAAFPPVLRQLLFNRGISADAEARAYLRAETNFDTNPFQMTGMEQAVARIRQAIAAGEAIAIYGDYDVDGVTATALLVETLRALGANVRGYIPNRFEEGYGLNKEALSHLKEDGVGLVISVDCGIRSPGEAAHARKIGLDLVITDHHHPGEELPPALAVINPKQPGDPYPDKDLAGVGIAYKLAQALRQSLAPASLQLDSLLDLVALGTVADLAPLTGENRSLVRGGLRRMRQSQRQGLLSLAAVADVPLARVNAMNIGFGLGPRLNASGRLESAIASFDLLTTRDVAQAGLLAQQLDGQNRERQRLTRDIQAQAETLALAEETDPFILFAVHPEFNPGVVGLAAARLTEAYYRPAIVGQVSEATTRCSCRSIAEFHITNALDECRDLLIRHGGHAAAAGFTVENDKLEALKARLREIAARELGGHDLRHTLVADAEVSLSDLNHDLLKYLDYLEPTGYGNPGAVFAAREVRVNSSRTVGADAKHLKLAVSDGRVTFDAIGFRLGEWARQMPPRVDLLFTFETNEFNGQTRLQLNLKDLKPSGTPD
jgi:single-stranded-DNA-specific exonuclease